VGLRIGVGFIFVLLVLIIVGLITLQSLNELDTAAQVAFFESDRAQTAYQIDAGLWSLVAVEKNILLQSDDAAVVTALVDEFEAQRDVVGELFSHWIALEADEIHEDVSEIQALQADYQELVASLSIVIDLALTDQQIEAVRLDVERVEPQLTALSTRIATNLEEEKGHRTTALANLSELQSGNTLYIMIVIAIALVVGIVLSYFISQSILQPVNNFVQVTRNFGEGDRTVRAQEAPDEIGDLARAFNQAVEQLDHLYTSLEQQVAERTRALETSTEVSRRLSTILDPNQLVREVVEQLRSAFGFYHAHIYLYDEGRQNLLMAGGTGDAGRTMLGRGHKIEKGRGLVGQAAETNQLVLIPDVSQAEGWLPNPLLPETKAEVAVPIAIGDEVLGVLDVQHNIVEGITQQEAELIQAIANQVAIAVRNAQAYSRTQRQAEREARVVAINQRIQSATRIEDVLQIAIRELGQALEAERSSIELQLHGLEER
ncbi:MAG: GAF domain-containing protein, partial [Anaerolineales bacterium]|nr:GAF domain-containing protein [Anaerolineales bacterium]